MNFKKATLFFLVLSLLIIFIAILSPQLYAKADKSELSEDEAINDLKILEKKLGIEIDEKIFDYSDSVSPKPIDDAGNNLWRLDVVGGWGGPVNKVQIDDVNKIAYLAAGQRFVILDITDIENPVELGSVNLLSSVEDFVVRDGYAYVATSFWPYRFTVLDVSNSEEPELVWYEPDRNSISCHRGFAYGVELYENVAYVTDNLGGVIAYDISDPTDVRFLDYVLGGYNPLGCPISWRIIAHGEEMEIVDNLLYLVEDDSLQSPSRLRIFDISSDPLEPRWLGEFVLQGANEEAAHVSIDGTVAYITTEERSTGTDFVYSIDVSEPTLPEQLDIVELTSIIPGRIDSYNGYVYIPDYQGFEIIDATDPNFLVNLGLFPLRGRSEEILISENRAYIMNHAEGLVMFDLTDPAFPNRVGQYYSPAALRQIKKLEDVLYVSDYWSGFSILNVSNPNHPEFLGFYQSQEHIPAGAISRGFHGLDIDNDIVYLVSSEGSGGIEAIDVSDLNNPVFLGKLQDLGRPQAVAVSHAPEGDIAHVAGWTTITTVNITNPQDMEFINFTRSLSGQLTTITLDSAKETAFAGGQRAAFSTADISDPLNPVSLYSGVPYPAADLVLGEEDESLVYVAKLTETLQTGGFEIYNVSNPANPVLVWNISHLAFRDAEAIDVQNDRVYVQAFNVEPHNYASPSINDPGYFHLHVFDVSNPYSPEFLWSAAGSSHESGGYDDIHVDEPFIYTVGSKIGDGQLSGLVVFDSRCKADLDQSTGMGTLDIYDFLAFQDFFVSEDPYVCDLDQSTGVGVCDIFDFLHFQDAFVAGCPA